MSAPYDFKEVLPAIKGRTITGYGTSAVDGQLDSLTIALDDGSSVSLTARSGGAWTGAHMTVKHYPAPPASGGSDV